MAKLAGTIAEIPFKALVDKENSQVTILDRNVARKMINNLIKIQSGNVRLFFLGHNLFLTVVDRKILVAKAQQTESYGHYNEKRIKNQFSCR